MAGTDRCVKPCGQLELRGLTLMHLFSFVLSGFDGVKKYKNKEGVGKSEKDNCQVREDMIGNCPFAHPTV